MAMNHLAKIRIGNTDDGLKYGGPESKDLYFQFVFSKEEDAEKFQNDILTIPQIYRKRFLNPNNQNVTYIPKVIKLGKLNDLAYNLLV